jgi:hypothetical protein
VVPSIVCIEVKRIVLSHGMDSSKVKKKDSTIILAAMADYEIGIWHIFLDYPVYIERYQHCPTASLNKQDCFK